MTTPAINTAYGVICDAYVDAGLVQEMNNPSPDQLATGLRRLRDVINFIQTQGAKLFLLEDIPVPLTDGVATYSFTPGGTVDMTKPLTAIQGYYLYTASGTRRQFTIMSYNDYLSLGQAGTLSANRGTISQFFPNKQASALYVTFWQCPDADEAANGAAHLLMRTQATNPINLTETTAFPDEWRIALHWGLADELATGQPQAIMNRCQQRAEMYRNMLTDFDVEDAPTQMQVDMRSSGNTGNFR